MEKYVEKSNEIIAHLEQFKVEAIPSVENTKADENLLAQIHSTLREL